MLSKILGAVGLALAVTCVPAPTAKVSKPPIVTVLTHGIAASAVVAVDGQRVFVGETQAGARPANTESRVLSVPLRGGPSQLLAETQHPGAITGLAAASDGTLFVSRWASASGMSTVSAYRLGNETILASATDAPQTATALHSSAGIAQLHSGDLLVADTVGSQILRISSSGRLERFAGTGRCDDGPLAAPVPGAALATALCDPELRAADDQGNAYVARKGSRWVVKIDPSGALSLLTSDVDVAGLATAPLGALLVTDATRGQIVRFRGGASSVLVTGIDRPTSLAAGSDGAIFVLAEGASDLLRIIVP